MHKNIKTKGKVFKLFIHHISNWSKGQGSQFILISVYASDPQANYPNKVEGSQFIQQILEETQRRKDKLVGLYR